METPKNVTLTVQSLKHKLVQDKVEVTIDQLAEALQKAEKVIEFAKTELVCWQKVVDSTTQRCSLINIEINKIKEKSNGKISPQ